MMINMNWTMSIIRNGTGTLFSWKYSATPPLPPPPYHHLQQQTSQRTSSPTPTVSKTNRCRPRFLIWYKNANRLVWLAVASQEVAIDGPQLWGQAGVHIGHRISFITISIDGNVKKANSIYLLSKATWRSTLIMKTNPVCVCVVRVHVYLYMVVRSTARPRK